MWLQPGRDSTSDSSETLLQDSAFLCRLILKEKWYLHLKWNKLRGNMILNLKGKWIESCSVVSDSLWPHGLYSPWNSLGQNTGVSILSLFQGIFPTQRSNPGLLHCRWILYQLSHKGSPRILEWVAYPFSSGSSWPSNRSGVSCIAGGFSYQLSYGDV